MGKATSLIELILKKWGDDAAGAAKELEDKIGFPESVANRIATGELPMDAESVAKRKSDWGGDLEYHGTRANGLLEVDPDKVDLGLHTGPVEQANNRLTQTREWADDVRGETIIPLMVRRGNEMTDMRDIGTWSDSRSVAKEMDNVGYDSYERLEELELDDRFYDGDDWLKSPANRAGLDEFRDTLLDDGFDSVRYKNQVENDYGGNSGLRRDIQTQASALSAREKELLELGKSRKPENPMPDVEGMSPEEAETAINAWLESDRKIGTEYHGEGFQYLSDAEKAEVKALQLERAKIGNNPDNFAETRSTITMRTENLRSPSAAFDPQYKGSNIMGGAAGTAGLAGLLAAGQSGDADAGPLTAAAKELLDKNFTESAVRSATDMAAAHKSREALTTMNIDEFLNLAQKGYAPDKFGALQSVDKFDEVPFLSIGYRDGSDGVAHVTGHEGRHRAMTLKSRGETQMPVRVRGDIRWDQQDTPNFDYVDDWPALLASQNEGITSPFPFKRGDSNLLDSSDMALRSKYTPPKKPEPKPDSYDTEILAELLDEFNFEKGNADPRLLAGTAAGTAGLLAAPMLADKDKPLPVPTWGDVGESVGGVLSMPITGLQGIARGLYGLATGEDIVTAGAEAAGVMGSEHKGSLMTPGMDSDKGADRMEKYVTEKTGDESLGWLTKMGLLLGGI